jgi:hypothetical protein
MTEEKQIPTRSEIEKKYNRKLNILGGIATAVMLTGAAISIPTAKKALTIDMTNPTIKNYFDKKELYDSTASKLALVQDITQTLATYSNVEGISKSSIESAVSNSSEIQSQLTAINDSLKGELSNLANTPEIKYYKNEQRRQGNKVCAGLLLAMCSFAFCALGAGILSYKKDKEIADSYR